jgi:hypothetical protein
LRSGNGSPDLMIPESKISVMSFGGEILRARVGVQVDEYTS